MKDWKKTLISPSQPVLDAMRIIDTGALQIALVVDERLKLLGVVTDGDIRRGILKGESLDAPVSKIMFRDFTYTSSEADEADVIMLMKKKELLQIPVLDHDGRVVNLIMLVNLINLHQSDNWVVLMAGGLGNRLKPLTDDCPKPLLKVNEKPLLEIIIENLRKQGFNKFIISVNYKAEMIEDHFQDGSRWDVVIDYLKENEAMGTAGALSLLSERPSLPLLVMNADLLTTINFRQLLDFHRVHGVEATMCVRDYRFQIPYGVVNLDHYRIRGVDEKPVHHFFVNAGIYVLSPRALDVIPQKTFYDMTQLFQDIIAAGRETAAFPVREYWMDIGRFDDFEKANNEYKETFEN
jgi:dTDP-glucose pyrophosphorylase